ncbi:hypothetical protein ZWY2020_013251 [Hordeum vulgare]|nr:hypothetical protein ZWY2020_013251 [Hordeum vulgare]
MPPSHVGLGRDAGPIVVAKPRDRFRFDWASTDDTSRVDAANNQPAHGALLLYGRGFLAGIDWREQKKAPRPESRYAILNRCNYVVLDEADRMIDMGFEPQVVGVLDEMPPSHLKPENADEELDEARTYMTTHMFSATMPPAMERLARKYLRNPMAVTVKPPKRRTSSPNVGTAIVFCNTKNSVEKLTNDLEYAGLSRVTALHGGKSQDERKASLDGFRNGRFNALVATDLAARGIDVPEVAHVINYEMPSSIDLYTHRIGRTGRARKKGLSTSFLTMEDTDIFYELKQMLVQSNSPVPPELARHEASRFKPGSIPGRPPRRNGTVHAYH